MRRHAFLAAMLLVAVGCNGTWAADASPQPTTSPTNSGKAKLKQSTNADLTQFVKARSAISTSIAEFNALVAKGKSSGNAKKLESLAGEINRQANTILQYAKSTNNTATQKLASRLILDDDVAGRQSALEATAKRLKELDAKLGLLNPVVHR